MSWSINLIGSPPNIIEALEKHSANLQGPSKTEFDEALPHMVGLVAQNYSNINALMLKLDASGHGHKNGDTQSNSCTFQIQQLYGTIV